MNDLPFISIPEELALHLKELKATRVSKKKKEIRKYVLTKADKFSVLEKTNYLCHICGCKVTISDFQADHVEVHSSSANNKIDNFLPSCRTCNNYRWFYEPEEIKWILKLGVWLKSEIRTNTVVGKAAAVKFINHEIKRHKRKSNNMSVK